MEMRGGKKKKRQDKKDNTVTWSPGGAVIGQRVLVSPVLFVCGDLENCGSVIGWSLERL